MSPKWKRIKGIQWIFESFIFTHLDHEGPIEFLRFADMVLCLQLPHIFPIKRGYNQFWIFEKAANSFAEFPFFLHSSYLVFDSIGTRLFLAHSFAKVVQNKPLVTLARALAQNLEAVDLKLRRKRMKDDLHFRAHFLYPSIVLILIFRPL